MRFVMMDKESKWDSLGEGFWGYLGCFLEQVVGQWSFATP